MVQSRLRRGLTILEVLVVVAIIAVLLGLLLPAVQQARLAAARIKEMNKMKQMALAIHSFSSCHDGRIPDWVGDEPSNGDSVFMTILPFLDNANVTAVGTGSYQPAQFQSEYDPSFSVPVMDIDAGECSYAINAVAYRNGPSLSSGFPDGTSNTIALTHHYARCQITGFSAVLAVYGCCLLNNTPIPCHNPTGRAATFADDRSDDALPIPDGTTGQTTSSIPGMTFQVTPTLDTADYRVPQALFPAGLLVTLHDGSVRIIQPGVSEHVFWGAVTPNGNEVLVDW